MTKMDPSWIAHYCIGNDDVADRMENNGLELLCLVYVLPVMVINTWEWVEEPGFMDKIIEKK